MNILYLAHRIPYPPTKGDKLRSFQQLKRLAGRHNVWCACFVDDPSDEQHIEALRRSCVDVAAVRLDTRTALAAGLYGLAAGRTLTESYYGNRRMAGIVRDWIRAVGFDAVVAFSSSMAQYARIPVARRVLDLCDCDSQKWLDYATISSWPSSALYRLEGKRLAQLEESLLQEFDATILITAAEAAALRRSASVTKLHVVGNGVDLPSIALCASHPCGEANELNGKHAGHERTECSVVGFIGAMDYRPNVDAVTWFAKNCWPTIRRTHARAEFRIVGRSPTAVVRRLGRISGVTVVGEVSDASTAVREFDISVAPLRIARGMQNKVLEALAHAKPVVLTSAAAAGLAGVAGRDFLIADGASEYGRQVCRLIADPAARAQLGQAGRAYVQASHCWDAELDRFELIVTGTTAGRSRLREPHVPLAIAYQCAPVQHPAHAAVRPGGCPPPAF